MHFTKKLVRCVHNEESLCQHGTPTIGFTHAHMHKHATLHYYEMELIEYDRERERSKYTRRKNPSATSHQVSSRNRNRQQIIPPDTTRSTNTQKFQTVSPPTQQRELTHLIRLSEQSNALTIPDLVSKADKSTSITR